MSTLDDTHSVHGAWLNAKGRVQALVRLLRHEQRILMLLDGNLAESAVKRMSMFVLRNDVRIEPAQELRVIGLMHPSRCGLMPFAGAANGEPGVTTGWHGLTLVRLGQDDSRVLVLGSETALVEGIEELKEQGVIVADEESWNRLEVDAGVARLHAANVDAFIPQMLNLDLVQGISFSKGCYPGQEIVARTQHLGRIKRRMFRARLAAGGSEVDAGASVYAAGAPDMAIGRVVRRAAGGDGDDGSVVLAVIALDKIGTGEGLSAGGVPLEEVSEPPYGLTPDPG